jgi:alpha-beta hydrolase superfamily lysophospholipase
MQHEEGTFQAAGEMILYYQSWVPEGNPRAILAIVHGFGEHSSRYPHVVEGLVPRGYAVYGFDLRGHGRSPGQRGHINAWAEYREDVRAFLQMIGEKEPGRPVFLLGHSMGALIALDYVMRQPGGLAGVVLSSLPIDPVGVAKAHLIAMARLLSRLWPTFAMEVGLETAALSRNPEVVRAYEEDPLVHGKATARWGTESLETVAWLKAHPAELTLPVLIIHGEADRLDAIEGVQVLFEQAASADKELKVDPGSYHEVHNDLDHAQMVSDLEAWLARHLPSLSL